jgi:hypothetical protein
VLAQKKKVISRAQVMLLGIVASHTCTALLLESVIISNTTHDFESGVAYIWYLTVRIWLRYELGILSRLTNKNKPISNCHTPESLND